MVSKIQFSVFIILINVTGFILSTEISSITQAPVLDVDKKVGYHGKIGEKNILVDLTPHLQIKNIDQINGICSYHVYKPSNEDFPFTIDIKDSKTGEAVIQLAQNELTNEYNEINCFKKKFYEFKIEAHDCTQLPESLKSEQVNVVIEIIDHNDYKLNFDANDYYASLTEGKIDDAIVIVKAKDEDCTNNGYACKYEIIEKDAPFKVNKLGFISNTRPLKKSEKILYDLTVRGYDCLDETTFAETSVHIDIVEPCHAEWSGFDSLVNATSVQTQIFTNNLKLDLCDDEDSVCTLDGYTATIDLDLNNFGSGCEVEKCGEVFTKYEFLDNTDSYETQEPAVFETFKKEKTIKTNFDGHFGDSFQLKAWIKRSRDSIDTNSKEHVFCGSDSELYNRHHYGFYFYRNNVKFLLRREKPTNGNGNSEEFYPSLWEWSIDSIEGDSKWHLYEVKYNYPNAALYIDGVKFEENTTNSDIIDAHELDNIPATGLQVTYVGGCYNARSHTFTNFFNGEIAGLNLFREQPTDKKGLTNKIECVKNCQEYLDLNMIGNENFLSSIELIQNNQIKLKTQTVTDLITLLQKINYINKNLDASAEALTKEKIGKRYVKLKAEMQCYKNPNNNTDESKISKVIKELSIDLDIKKPRQEFNVQIEGNKQYLVSKDLLYNKGISLFKDVSITKIPINKVNNLATQQQQQPDDDSIESVENDLVVDDSIVQSSTDDNLYFSSCSIRILPANDNEKFILTPFNDDEIFGNNDAFKLSKVNDVVMISGINTVEDYENYLKNILYTITPSVGNEEEEGSKQFYLSCVRDEPTIETNSILIQLNVTTHKEYIAFKQMNKFTADDDIVENRVFGASPSNSNTVKASSPIIVVVIVLSSGLLAFILVLTAIRMKNSRERRRGGFQLPNEENPYPQMEWDDSLGLNIIANPLEELEATSAANVPVQRVIYEEEDEEDSSSDDGSENGDYYNSEEEDEAEKIIEKELEWDDDRTTLEINGRRM